MTVSLTYCNCAKRVVRILAYAQTLVASVIPRAGVGATRSAHTLKSVAREAGYATSCVYAGRRMDNVVADGATAASEAATQGT